MSLQVVCSVHEWCVCVCVCMCVCMCVCVCVCDEYGVQAIYITIKCVHSCICTCFVKIVTV